MRNAPYTIPESKKIRVIIDTDAGCEADDLFAIVHALLTPKFEVRAICPEHYGTRFVEDSHEDSYREVKKLLHLMGLEDSVTVCHGGKPFAEDGSFEESEASRFIVEEAMRDDPRPLYVLVIGAVTNVAAALRTKPEITDRMLLVGGRIPDGGWYFNSCNDVCAYNVLLDSNVEWWTVDVPEGQGFQVSLTHLYEELEGTGELGKYLFDRVCWSSHTLAKRMEQDIAAGFIGRGNSKAALAAMIPAGETWEFWDCATVGLAMFDHHDKAYEMVSTPRLLNPAGAVEERPGYPRKVRSYHTLDSYMIMNDFFAKLRYYFRTPS